MKKQELLADERFVVFVVSTMGQGDPPDSMKGFWRYLLQKRVGAQLLQGLHYVMFGLGDSGYQKYNFPAKKLDQRLLDLGAKRIMEKGLGDDQHPAGYEGALDRWLQSLWKSLNETNPSHLPRISDIIHPNLDVLGMQRYEVSILIIFTSNLCKLSNSKRLIERPRSMSPALKFHNDGEPQYMLQTTGVLSLEMAGGFFVAFSRGQPEKIYVQDKIKEQSARVVDILCFNEAAIYDVLCQGSGVSKENASGWLKELKMAGRFVIETWS
uniref:Flavodoxin-like domain-containing protein n=1 Tax=Setaria viridis TaxID=4556 RepID=A0A4U6VJN7_SETVI|nr:hypothetical protein SEVIR_3G313600v2 [Setaria viridis]